MSQLKPRHSHGKKGREKKRCSYPKCKKLAKDFSPPLCRIHSPKRLGYKKFIKEVKNANKHN